MAGKIDKQRAEQILKFYRSKDFRPRMPDGANWRHFRMRTIDNQWRKVPCKISREEQLREWVVKYKGLDIYYGTSRWLNPHKVSAKGLGGTYAIADNIIFGNDLVFDIDAEEPVTMKSLDAARKTTYNIYRILEKDKQFEFQYCAWTGGRGFRLAYKDRIPVPENPRQRLDYIEKNRKLFIDGLQQRLQEKKGPIKLLKAPNKFDINVTQNPLCVVRVLGTIHSTTGYQSRQFPETWLKQKDIVDILDEIPFIGERPVIPHREMTRDRGEKSLHGSRTLSLGEDASGLSSSPSKTEICYFVTNRVLGVKRGFIPIFVYQTSQKYYLDEVQKLQQEFNLGPLYVSEIENKIIVISLKCMQKRQCQKVLNKSSSRAKYDFKKYHRILAPFSLGFDRKVDSKFTGHLSKGHLKYVEPANKRKAGLCGWDKVELVRATRMKNGV